MISSSINHSQIWAKLHQHQRATRHLHMRDLFQREPLRFERMHLQLDGLLVDYSKNRLTSRTLDLLCELADAADLSGWMARMRCGEHINVSEDRAVLHTVLRTPRQAETLIVDGQDVIADVHVVLDRMTICADKIRQGKWLGFQGMPIRDVVNLGIGGSDLGPKMVTEALAYYADSGVNVHFVSNIDGGHLARTLQSLNPATTLFIVASKSFTTPETLLNAQAARDWLLSIAEESAIARHFVAVSCNQEAVTAFGIDAEHMFPFWDWVGGRYSVWSAIGLPLMIAIGPQRFSEFLAGGHAMDQHFFNQPFRQNIPVLLALIGIWYSTFYGAHTHAIMPYDHGLRFLPAHLQQLDMESNGKRVGRLGERLDFNTGPIIWGEEGINSQHAFFQLLHQGTRLIPSDFVIPLHNHYELDKQRQVLIANALAQTEALMRGKTESEVLPELETISDKIRDELLPQKLFPGNQPTNTLLIDELTPYAMGSLLALYEHRTFVQGIIWGINSFDQWGVEYGKQLARCIIPQITDNSVLQHDSSTNGLIAYVRQNYSGQS